MHVRVTGDTNAESGVGEIVGEVSGPLRQYFLARDYGEGLLGVVVVLMCRDPQLKFKQRIRLSKKEKKLYMDIMLESEEMTQLSTDSRRRAISERITTEVPQILARYAPPRFDSKRFVADLTEWMHAWEPK